MQKIVRLCAAAFALCLGLALVPATMAPAQAKGSICTPIHFSKKNTHHVTKLAATVWVKECRRPRSGPDIVWEKPSSQIGSYFIRHRLLHPNLWCEPFGTITYYVFRIYIWNNVTGYNAHHGMKVGCDEDGKDSGLSGLIHLPRCYVPMVIDSEGRGGLVEHRAWCHYRFTVEEVHFAANPNTHYTIGQGWMMP